MSQRPSAPSPLPILAARGLVLALGSLLAAAPPADCTLEPTGFASDSLGQSHSRQRLRYQGLRVLGSERIAHAGPDGPLAPTGPAWQAALEPAPPVALLPDLSLADAHRRIRAHLGMASASAQLSGGETVLVPLAVAIPLGRPGPAGLNAAQIHPHVAGYALAYLVRASDPYGGPGAAWNYLVDAHSGRILRRVPANPADSPARGVGHSLYSGQVALDTTAAATGFLLKDPLRGRDGRFGGNAVLDFHHGYDDFAATLYTSFDNVWGDGRVETDLTPAGSSTVTGTTIAADAAYGIQSTWNYLARIHQRNGWDDKGTAVTAKVHFRPIGVGFDNAFWSDYDSSLTITDGQRLQPCVELQTIAHEIFHGVTHATADLEYAGESGGLNEATSDIFGCLVEAHARAGGGATIGDGISNWIVEQHVLDAAGALAVQIERVLFKPSLDGGSLDAWSPDLGDLDVHQASGPMNRAFFFLSHGASPDSGTPFHSSFLPAGMTGIGNDKAAAIWYRALSTYLVPDSRYLDARIAALRAAGDLYGADSAEAGAVAKAFAAINVGDGSSAVPATLPTVLASAEVTGASLVLTAIPAQPEQVPEAHFFIDGLWLAKASDSPRQQLLGDPGLEGGAASPWTGDPELVLVRDLRGAAGHDGFGYARFDRGHGRQNLSLAQTVEIPAGSAYARLSLWTRIQTGPGSSSQDTPKLTAAGTPLATLTPADAREDWIRRDFDLSALAGRSVDLTLAANLEPGSATAFQIDDLTLVCSPNAEVDVAVAPATLELLPGASSAAPLLATVTGTAMTAVTWTLDGGSLGPDQRYTAPAAPGFYHATATSQADPGARAQVSIQVLQPIEIRPASLILETGASATLDLGLAPGVVPQAALREGPVAGSIRLDPRQARITYTAPATPGSYHLDVSDPAHPAHSANSATATLVVVAPISLTLQPPAITLAPGASADFTALIDGSPSHAVLWALQEGAAGGRFAGSGPGDRPPTYTAPMAPGVYHLIATSTANPARSAVATITVLGTTAIDPVAVTLLTGERFQFSATLPAGLAPGLAWTLEGPGAISSTGLFTAPDQPGATTVLALPAANSALGGRAVVTTRTTDLNGDGQVVFDFADLALLADALEGPGVPAANPAADLNGDGVVDDLDLARFLLRFRGGS